MRNHGELVPNLGTFPPKYVRRDASHSLKLSQLFQFLHAPVNVGAFDFRGARQAKAFAAK